MMQKKHFSLSKVLAFYIYSLSYVYVSIIIPLTCYTITYVCIYTQLCSYIDKAATPVIIC